jgi:hypothetical protein
MSICLDGSELDHLSPLLGFVGHELAEIGGRARKHRRTQVSKPRLSAEIAQLRAELGELRTKLAFGERITALEAKVEQSRSGVRRIA